ncbi:hypothetical protein [Tolypothrix sp. NIES-4075]|nr:hypothetical protein [Tolypothrix sp. NIES-4075]
MTALLHQRTGSPITNYQLPIPHFSIITIGKTSHQVEEGKNHPTIY